MESLKFLIMKFLLTFVVIAIACIYVQSNPIELLNSDTLIDEINDELFENLLDMEIEIPDDVKFKVR